MNKKPIHYDSDYNGNYIENAKVPVKEFIDDEDIINKKHVDDSLKYETELSKNLPTVESVGGIESGTENLDVKSVKEVLDLTLYPLKSPTYIQPELELILSNEDSIIKQTGFPTDIELTANLDLNDSNGLVSYTFSGDGIETPVSQNGNTFIISDYQLNDGNNSWTVSVSYLGSLPKKDTHGNYDTNGSFNDGSIKKTFNMVIKNPILYGVHYAEKDITLDLPENLNNNVDHYLDYVEQFDVELGTEGACSFNIAIPYPNSSIKVYVSGLDVTNSFSNSLKQNVKPWKQDVGEQYQTYHLYTNIPLTKPTIFTVKVFIKNYSRIVDVDYNPKTNTLSLNDDSNFITAWNVDDDEPIGSNPISIKDTVDGYMKIVSTIGTIRKVERARPYTLVDDLDFFTVYVPNLVGVNQHLTDTDIYSFRIWLSPNNPPKGNRSQSFPI